MVPNLFKQFKISGINFVKQHLTKNKIFMSKILKKTLKLKDLFVIPLI